MPKPLKKPAPLGTEWVDPDDWADPREYAAQGLPYKTWICEDCRALVELWWPRETATCDNRRCSAEYNPFGQRLNDHWRENPAWKYGVGDDLDGAEIAALARDDDAYGA